MNGLFSPLHLVILLLVALLLFGAKRLPEIGRSLGGGIREFKDSVTNADRDNNDVKPLPPPAFVPPPVLPPAPAPVVVEEPLVAPEPVTPPEAAATPDLPVFPEPEETPDSTAPPSTEQTS